MLHNSILKEVITVFMGYKLDAIIAPLIHRLPSNVLLFINNIASVALKQRADYDVNSGECGIYLKNEFAQRCEKGIYACEGESLGIQPLKYEAFSSRIQ
jgi:hypothetical protein